MPISTLITTATNPVGRIALGNNQADSAAVPAHKTGYPVSGSTNASIGRKDDSGKLRMDLIPWSVILYLAKVYTFGASKYDDRNWEKGIKYSRVFAAALRHLMWFWLGQSRDKESGLPHLAHCLWGIAALLFYECDREKYNKFDDRSEAGSAMIELLDYLSGCCDPGLTGNQTKNQTKM